MIIFGSRGITTTPQTGDFFCPVCNMQTHYSLKRVRNFFTLYFIPLIPLNVLGEYVECANCQGTFDTDVFNYDPAAAGAQLDVLFHVAAKQVMIGMTLADGVVEPQEITMLQGIFKEMTGEEIPEPELQEEIAHVQNTGLNTLELITELAPSLNESGKETIMHTAWRIASSDGNVHETETAYMAHLTTALGLTPAHARGIMSEIKDGGAPGQLPGSPPPLPPPS